MEFDEWNESDTFDLRLQCPTNPLDRGFAGLEEVLDILESLDDELRPDTMGLIKRQLKYSRQTLRKRLHEAKLGENTVLSFSRSRAPEATFWVDFVEGNEDARFFFKLRLTPFAFYREPGKVDERAASLVGLVRAVASRFPPSYGLAHSDIDFLLGTDPHTEDPFAPKQVYEAYWLNVYGPRMVEAIGRARLLSTPAAHMEELPHGSVLWLTRPTPADFYSEEARLAQARALVHLRPELKLEETLSTLRQRSLNFVPTPIQFHPDVAEILLQEVEFEGLLNKRQRVERFNQYRPSPVSEWFLLQEPLMPDVPDVEAAIHHYWGTYAEQLVALLHEDVPSVMKGSPESLPRIDWRMWRLGWGKRMSHEAKEKLIPALGAYLGQVLVTALGGRWVPRRNLDEAAVIIGDRAWLPFLRARHYLQGENAPLDFSLTQLFHEASRRCA